MDRSVLMALVLVLLVVLLLLLPLGWYARKRRQRDLVAPLPVPPDRGTSLGSFDGKYVATTAEGDPYDRIAVHGLGFRSDVTAEVTEGGLLLVRPGEADTWIPRSDLRGLRRETWTIDRVVENNGLHLVQWMLGARTVDTYLRLDDPAGFDSTLTPVIPTERTAS